MSIITRLLLLPVLSALCQCSIAQSPGVWLTTPDRQQLLAQQEPLRFTGSINSQQPVILVNPNETFQQMDGFGFALTGGSAQHIIRMDAAERKTLLQELFGQDRDGMGISYLRLSIGASDLNQRVFSYNDLPAGKKDPTLSRFSLADDEKDVVPVMKEILAINPAIKILGSPWSAPTWMKSNNNIQGGRLQEEYYPVYARYFVKYIRAMEQQGIRIDAITVQNEPFNDGNTPSMQMLAKEQLRFIRDHLGPLFKKEGITTRIILYDHNCDAPEYPMAILADSTAARFIDGSGFHLYAGPVSAMSRVHDAFPTKGLYFTEMMAVNRDGQFNIANPVERILIGATRNWSRNVILWNLAANAKFEPHTDNGGCAFCQGAVTIEGNAVERNIALYVIGHASRFVPPASYRIASNTSETLPNVAFRTPTGRIVLIVANKSAETQAFNIATGSKAASAKLPAGAVATYTW
ncbi:MAG: glycoside hydrolase family 30 beta sandwich domain-containing protein [Candidatus Pseudobacter hemicellulosilyticus]|uniref:Glycoside hydrolase family 30 beta sandwich domain-containing protein n=1 Tax=Candidatus Pseudobacter hemicellulosilyticus TaxID=3121375 RepID=A0AAJ6BHQ6_9BACT|nr:MAG: glycoside hydrolase family 30 beta sandwich domain-containing protein [Pseudobacter sp.]